MCESMFTTYMDLAARTGPALNSHGAAISSVERREPGDEDQDDGVDRRLQREAAAGAAAADLAGVVVNEAPMPKGEVDGEPFQSAPIGRSSGRPQTEKVLHPPTSAPLWPSRRKTVAPGSPSRASPALRFGRRAD